MTNSNNPNGLMATSGQAVSSNEYYIPNTLAKLSIGTVVALSGTSNTTSTIKGQNFPIGSLPAIVVATGGTGNAILGSIIGFVVSQDDMSVQSGVNPASTEGIAIVADDPTQIFEIVDDGLNIIAPTSIGLNANLTIGTVNAVGVDSTKLKTSDIATTVGFQLKILGVSKEIGNEGNALNTKFVVSINNHQRASNTVGV
tara:strand:- start:515 stop:1111 length:597 start_codon:yes stop_codon:yes gene_type:complete